MTFPPLVREGSAERVQGWIVGSYQTVPREVDVVLLVLAKVADRAHSFIFALQRESKQGTQEVQEQQADA